MANKTKATPQKEEAPEKGPETPDAPLPLLDLSDAAVKKMIKQAKKRGYVTYEQLNAVMPSEEVTSEQIEDILAMINEMGINVVETEEAEADEEEEPREEPEEEETESANWSRSRRRRRPSPRPRSRPSAPTIRCACICAKWARSELLSREGEIAIAKRIEAGREAMIAGLCESPLTFQAIIIWRDELNEGKVFLRDIIDLEATYAGPDAKNVAPAGAARRSGAAAGAGAPACPGFAPQPPQAVAPPSAPPAATPFKPQAGGDGADGEEAAPRRAHRRSRSGRGRSRELDVACRHRGRAQAQGARDLRQRSPTPSSGCAACRTRTSRTSSRTRRCRRRRSASTRSSRKRSSTR